MAGLGTPLAFRLGGGPSPQEQVYDTLKVSVGVGNSAEGQPTDSIIESWRYAKARALVALFADDRAVAQGFPQTATDFIPVYEQLLRLFFDQNTSDQAKRDALSSEWYRKSSAVITEVEERLKEIDPSISVFVPDRDLIRETQPGRAFEDYDPASGDADGPAFNLVLGNSGSKCTSSPNYSDDFVWFVIFPLTASTLTKANRKKIVQIEQLLNKVIPSWNDFRIYTADSGFVLDEDLLDLTIFG